MNTDNFDAGGQPDFSALHQQYETMIGAGSDAAHDRPTPEQNVAVHNAKAKAYFEANVVRVPGGCWSWSGKTDRNGIPWVCIGPGKWIKARQFSWEIANGPLPEGTVLTTRMKECQNKRCLNDAHMQPKLVAKANADNLTRFRKRKSAKPRGGHYIKGKRVSAAKRHIPTKQ